ncbi:MAG: ATP-binding protein [Ignavibacteria bacterium]|jgi:anti-sigma regulatory factor (Ser/Thr protein kinase)|nr:ATP-binding protein [Ignavibacteria bacterium]
MKTASLQLKNKNSEILVLAKFLEKLSLEWKEISKHTSSLNLALEEAISNVINYAYNDEKEHLIQLVFSLNSKELAIQIIDDGVEFNPILKEDSKSDLPLEERNIGGLGILFIKKVMDQLHYERKGNKNIFTIIKNI